MIKTLVLSGLALALASGCTTYEQGGLFGGFNEVPLASDTYRIQGYGNGFAGRSQTNAIALVRAAELATEHGYSRFVILDYNEWAKTEYQTSPTTAKTTTDFDGRAVQFGLGINYSGQSQSTTTIDHGETTSIEKPRTDVVVRFVSNNSWEAGKALIAGDIIARYGPIAGLKPEQVAVLLEKSPRPAGTAQFSEADAVAPKATEPEPEPFGPPVLTRRVTNRY